MVGRNVSVVQRPVRKLSRGEHPPPTDLDDRRAIQIDDAEYAAGLRIARRDHFLESHVEHLVGFAVTGVALVLLGWSIGPQPLFLAWLSAHFIILIAMTAVYIEVRRSKRSDDTMGTRVALVTVVSSVHLGLFPWLDVSSMSDPRYALAICAAMCAFAAGTMLHIAPLVSLVRIALLPALTLLFAGLLIGGSTLPAICIFSFMVIVLSRPLVVQQRAMERRVRMQVEADWRANHDALTGMLNRRGLLNEIDAEMSDQWVKGAGLAHGAAAVLFVDLDGFKQVNDSLGHRHGDEVLCHVADRLIRTQPRGSVSARLGGDEFVIWLTDVTPAQAESTAHAVRESLSRRYEVAGVPIRLRASIGVANAGVGGAGPERLISEADAAMYRAKSEGGGVRVFDEALRSSRAASAAIFRDMEAGLERGEFTAHFQPWVDVESGRVAGFEAYARWRHGDRMIAAADFIDAAQGLLPEITLAVARESEQLVLAIELAGLDTDLRIVLNAGPADLDPLRLWLTSRPEFARKLVLELARGASYESEFLAERLDLLARMGVTIALGHLGSSTSSLASIRPHLDVFKLDGALVGQVCEADDARAVAKFCIGLARKTGRTLVAEQVETAEQAAVLAEMGVGLMQGWYLQAPFACDEALAFLADRGTLPGTGDGRTSKAERAAAPRLRRGSEQVAQLG